MFKDSLNLCARLPLGGRQNSCRESRRLRVQDDAKNMNSYYILFYLFT